MSGVCGTGYRLADPCDGWPVPGPLPQRADEAIDEWTAGRALCLHGEHGAFVIALRPGENPDQLEAFVLLAVASRHGAFENAEPAVLAIARDLTATTVAFRSVRRGWARRLGPAWMPRGSSEFWRYVDERQI